MLFRSHLTHLALSKGQVTLSARPEGIDASKSDRWWTPPAPSSEGPLADGQWMRVLRAQGKPRMRRRAGGGKAASPGEALLWGDTLETGPEGVAWGLLRGGFVGAFHHQSALTASESAGRTEFKLFKGRFHITGAGPRARGPRFITPTTVAGVRGPEFEVQVSEDGRSDWVPFSGTLDLEAAPLP